MLFYGPSGAGKKTRILCTLRALFGPGVEKVRVPSPLLGPNSPLAASGSSNASAGRTMTADFAALPARSRPPAAQVKIDQRVFVTPSRRKLDVNVVQSNYHIELTPSSVPLLSSASAPFPSALFNEWSVRECSRGRLKS